MKVLSKGELILLKYSDGASVEDDFPQYFYYVYNIDVKRCLDYFLKYDLLNIAPLSYTLSKYTVAELKNALQKYELKTTGKKQDLILRLLENVNKEELKDIFKKQYYNVSKQGKELLKKELSDFVYNNRYINLDIPHVDRLLYLIGNNDYSSAEKLLLDNKIESFPNHSKYQLYNIFKNSYVDGIETAFNKEQLGNFIILCYIYGMPAEHAKLRFQNKYKIELPYSIFHKYLRILHSIDELISAKSIAKSVPYKYSIQTMQDERCCEFCKNLEGKKFDVCEAEIGVNYPPFEHCINEYCRCFTVFEINSWENVVYLLYKFFENHSKALKVIES